MKKLKTLAFLVSLAVGYATLSSHVSAGEWVCDKVTNPQDATGHCAKSALGSGNACFTDIYVGDLCDGYHWEP